jgi:alpha/beta superfamily hydrolase
MEGAEHFFHGRLVELRDAVMTFAEAELEEWFSSRDR